MAKQKKELTKSQWLIMKAIWGKSFSTAPDVQQMLEKQTNWTYSTVKTLMDRMVEKKMLSAEKIRNLTIYKSLLTEKQAQSNEILSVVKKAFKGAFAPMMQFLIDSDKLSDAELEQIQEMLKKRKKYGKNQNGL